MKLSFHVPLFLALGLAANARRFIHRSEIVPPSSCVPKGQIPAKSASNIPPPAKLPAASSGQKAPPIISGNSGVDQNSTIPLIGDSINGANGTLIPRGFSRVGFPSFLLEWQDLCLASGGDILSSTSPCFFGSTHAFDVLLATADVCAQQEVADAMITFAKGRGILNRNDLISFAVGFRRHPREAVRILGVVPGTPYCLKAPINPELIGVFNKQTVGVTVGVYGGPNYPIIKFGSPGSCPFGTQPDISSCTCAPGKVISTGGSSGASTGNGTVIVDGSSDGTNSTATDSGSSNSTATSTSTASNSTATDSTAGSSNSTDTSTDGSAGNSTQTDTTGSAGNSTQTDSTDSTETGTDSSDSTATDSSDGSSDSTETGTDSGDSTGTDSTDESSSAGGDATQTSTASTSTATDDGGFSGDVNDPNGR